MGATTGIEWTDKTWKTIPGYDGYMVSDMGDVRGIRGQAMKPMQRETGHLYIIARVQGKGIKLYLHRAVLLAFRGEPLAGCEARHLDGNPANNCLSNLAWGSRKANTEDARRHGTLLIGEKSKTAKLTAAQVLEIRRLHSG